MRRISVDRIHDDALREQWRRKQEQLTQTLGTSPREADSALTYLWHFTLWFNAEAKATTTTVADLRTLHGTREGCDIATRAWAHMREACGLRGRYLRRVQTLLGRALAVTVEALSVIVHPVRRLHARTGLRAVVRLHARLSSTREFDLHDCLPVPVRSENGSCRYQVLMWLGVEMAQTMRTASKGTMQKVLAFLDRMVAVDASSAQGVDDVKRSLRGLSAVAWVERYARIFGGSDRPRIAPAVFAWRMHKLRVLYNQVLQPHAPLRIPAAFRAGVVMVDGGDGACSSSSEASSTTSSSTTTAHGEDTRRLRAAIYRLWCQTCKHDHAAHAPEDEEVRRYAFSPAEVRRILEATLTTEERLVVLLFLTTGLRIGGLARLRLPATLMPQSAARGGRDVPPQLFTTEKNGKVRQVALTPACRILIARCVRVRAAAAASPYLFPGRDDEHVSTRTLWDRCRAVFERARLRGPHVHPHTFRHTFVQMLYMNGMTFEAIAKFIGHSSAAITSGVYGRLRQVDILESARDIPFLGDGGAVRCTAEDDWRAVATLLRDPWGATADEWEGLATAGGEGGNRQHQRKRSLDELVRATRLHREEQTLPTTK